MNHRGAGVRTVTCDRATDLNRFTPQVSVARRKVDELISRGAVITRVRSNQVTLRRGEQVATIDGWGRVEWAS